MPFSSTLLCLRSNAPGLPGPFLKENLAPYQLFDDLGKTKVRVILAIGGQTKARYLYKQWLIAPGHNGERSVALAAVDDRTLLLDCDLHLCDGKIPRVQGGPHVGASDLHLLKHTTPSTTEIAYSLYIEVLSLFSDIVLISIRDFGGLDEVIEFLCLWLTKSITTKPVVPCSVVLLETERTSMRDVRDRVFAAFTSQLKVTDPTTPFTPTAVKRIIDDCFRIRVASQSHHGCKYLNAELEVSACDRAGRGVDFTAHHTKELLRAAIRHHAEASSDQFDYVTASRITNPVPGRLTERLIMFLEHCEELRDEESGVVASALMMDAYPPDMHCKYLK